MSQQLASKRLIKSIVAELITILVISIVLLVIAFWLGGLSEEKQKEADTLTNELNAKTGELQTLKAKMAQFKDAVPLRESLKNEDGKVNLDLSRDKATNIFLDLKDIYVLKDIKITISPVKILTDPLYVKANMQAISSDINITMKAYSDIQVLKFIHDVTEKLPGAVKIKTFTITRGNPKSLKDDATPPEQSFYEPLLDVKIDLVWYGIQDIEKKTDPAMGSPPIPGGMAPPPEAMGVQP